jgi:hypothetical protein
MDRVILVKGGDGSGWAGPPKGTHIASSKTIDSLESARRYWLDNLGGKCIPVVVNRKAGAFEVKVNFPPANDHAFTKSVDKSNRRSGRAFNLQRARLMDQILSAIAHPSVLLTNHGKDLFFEKIDGQTHYCIVLRWKDSKEYEFESAHPWSLDELKRARQSLQAAPIRGKTKAPLNKSIGAFHSAFTVLEPSGSGALCDPGDAHSGIGLRNALTVSGLLMHINGFGG